MANQISEDQTSLEAMIGKATRGTPLKRQKENEETTAQKDQMNANEK